VRGGVSEAVSPPERLPATGDIDASGATPTRSAGAPSDRPSSGAAAVVRLLVAVAAIVTVALLLHGGDLLLVIVAIVGMVAVHEFGHFVTAKWSGMKVTEAFIGFGPRLWSIRKGETEYGVKAIPAGAYVRIVGMSNLEEVDPADEPRTYRQQSFPRRLLVALAGSGSQLLLALVGLWVFLVTVGVPQPGAVSILGLVPVSHGVDPARAAGLAPGDVVVGVDGHRIAGLGQLVDVVGAHPDRPITLQVERAGHRRTVAVTPAPVPVGSGRSRRVEGKIGVLVGAGPDQSEAPLRAVGTAAIDVGRVISGSIGAIQTTFSIHGLASFFDQLGNARAAARAAARGTRPESIYGAIRTATQGAEAGPAALVSVLVSIDVFVALANLFPMLPLDGGHVLVAVYERLRSRRGRRYVADVAKLTPVAYAFVVFLIVFVGSAVFLDITHPVANPFG
jgi:membrane-associated protease RseP (regulator of RpoE activity)